MLNYLYPLFMSLFGGMRMSLAVGIFGVLETLTLYLISPTKSADNFGALNFTPEEFLLVRTVVEMNGIIICTSLGVVFRLYATRTITALAETAEVRRRFISNMVPQIRHFSQRDKGGSADPDEPRITRLGHRSWASSGWPR